LGIDTRVVVCFCRASNGSAEEKFSNNNSNFETMRASFVVPSFLLFRSHCKRNFNIAQTKFSSASLKHSCHTISHYYSFITAGVKRVISLTSVTTSKQQQQQSTKHSFEFPPDQSIFSVSTLSPFYFIIYISNSDTMMSKFSLVSFLAFFLMVATMQTTEAKIFGKIVGLFGAPSNLDSFADQPGRSASKTKEFLAFGDAAMDYYQY